MAAVNAAGLCGHTDWRLPSEAELNTIMDSSVFYPGPSIDTNWFPNTQDGSSAAGGWFWSSSPAASNAGYAWVARFDNGYDSYVNKATGFYVRLVRAGL